MQGIGYKPKAILAQGAGSQEPGRPRCAARKYNQRRGAGAVRAQCYPDQCLHRTPGGGHSLLPRQRADNGAGVGRTDCTGRGHPCGPVARRRPVLQSRISTVTTVGVRLRHAVANLVRHLCGAGLRAWLRARSSSHASAGGGMYARRDNHACGSVRWHPRASAPGSARPADGVEGRFEFVHLFVDLHNIGGRHYARRRPKL